MPELRRSWYSQTNMPLTQLKPPTHMLREILSQPECWSECIRQLENDAILREITANVPADSEWLFIGCGTSYYLALSAAASFSAITGMPARAVPASEVLLFPDTVLPKRRPIVPVLISRSGRTTEVVKARDYLEDERGIRTIAITCAADQVLAQASCFPIILSAAEELSTVMTRSFSSMLLGLQYLAATLIGDVGVLQALKHLPKAAEPLFLETPPRLRDVVDRYDFDDYVFLGHGPFYGIACEAALKVMESSCSYAQSFHSLEFRHGPKSIVSAKTMVGFFLSDAGYAAEVDLLEEIKSLGAITFVVTPRVDSRVRARADLLVEVPMEGPECLRLAGCIPWGQLLGLYTGLKKGLNPDSPRNLSQVVILNEIP
ncbi:MAG: SIS domain-containing protein [Acidobacteriia bacterium]|nr:SIS domain-containing protein [Terriglobia bacterium]